MSSSSPCAACKFLRRKCTQECIFAPYFPPHEPHRFANVHKVFGASNVAKILQELEPDVRKDAVVSLVFEAESRLQDPVYGCLGYISVIQQRLKDVCRELAYARQELARVNYESACLPIPENPSNDMLLPLYNSNNDPSLPMVSYVGPSYGGSQLPSPELQTQMAEVQFMRQQQGIELQRQMAEEGLMERQQEHMFVGLANRQFDLSGPVSGGQGFEPVTVAIPLQPVVMGGFDNSFNQQIEQTQELHNSEIQQLLLLRAQQQPQSSAQLTRPPEQQLFLFESAKDTGPGGVGPSC